MDPLIFESAIAEDTFPENNKTFAPSDLSIFCFSTGVKSWLFPRSANQQVRKIFIETDKYQTVTVGARRMRCLLIVPNTYYRISFFIVYK